MRIIKRLNYYIMLSLSLIQLGTIIWFCCILTFFSIYIHITNWSFAISSIYLFLTLFCDTSLYFFNSKKFENLNYFLRNSFAKVAYPYCFLITIGFWSIILIGLILGENTFTKKGATITAFRIILNLHLHLGITIIMFIELFLNKREEMKLSLNSWIANIGIFIVYCIMVSIAKYAFERNAYAFMENMGVLAVIGLAIVIFALLVGCVFLFNFISNRINRKYFNNNNDDELKDEDEIINSDKDKEYILGE